MFSFCADFSYYRPMPMMMPFGSLCCGGGNSFWGAFLGGFLGSSIGSGGYVPQAYCNNYSYGYGAYSAPIFNYSPMYMPASTMMMPSPTMQMPQFNLGSSMNFDFSGNYNYASSPFASMPDVAAAVTSTGSGIEAYNPFSYKSKVEEKEDKSKDEVTSKKKATGTKFDSKSYMSGDYATRSYNTNSNLPVLANSGYNSSLANKLVNIAMQDKKSNAAKGGDCATYVKRAIQKAGLGKYESGDAYACADILARNTKHFREIKVSPSDIPKLPAGCVIVYPQGDMHYSDDFGHIEITLGNGQGVSDKVYNVSPSSKARVFVPISS